MHIYAQTIDFYSHYTEHGSRYAYITLDFLVDKRGIIPSMFRICKHFIFSYLLPYEKGFRGHRVSVQQYKIIKLTIW